MKETIHIRVAVAIDKRGHWEVFGDGYMGSADPRDDSHAMGHARQDLGEREEIPSEEIETFMLTAERQIEFDPCPDCPPDGHADGSLCQTCCDNGRIYK